MILADKLIALRKKNGWSQEEVAERVNVTRQAVSKWEGAQATPDLSKVLKLAELFGVSTDYLLKDELEEEEYTGNVDPAQDDAEPMRHVTLEEANAFLSVKEHTAGRIALAVMMCIIAAVCLIMLAVAGEKGVLGLAENTGVLIGLVLMFLIIAAAVAIFVNCGMKTSRFEYLEKEVFETAYGVTGMVRERQKQYQETYTRFNVLGTCICISSVIPIFMGICFERQELIQVALLCLGMLVAGVGAMCFIVVGVNWASMQKLLQEGEYTRKRKRSNVPTGAIGTLFWLTVAAVYLHTGFSTNDWKNNWIILVIGGILFAAVMTVCGVLQRRSK